MTSRFADAFFYIAQLDARDQHHASVTAYMQTHDDFLITTRWVLIEVANAMASLPVRQKVAGWLQFVERDSNTLIVKSSDSLYLHCLKLYSERPDKAWSLTDCISFVVMQEHDIHEALTGDHHFEQAGFLPLFAA